MRHLTPERARLYDRWIFPWATRLIGLWILLYAYARPFPESGAWQSWFMDWGKNAAGQALATGEQIWRAEWDSLSLTGWTALVVWIIAVKVVKRITPLYSWPVNRFMAKSTTVTVLPDKIGVHGSWYESEAVDQMVVMAHSDLVFHAAQDKERIDAGGKPSGKFFYYQNAYDVAMPYHGQPVVLFSIYGSQLAAENVAARITLARQLAVQDKVTDEEADEFGPSPSLPGDEMP